MDMNQPRDLLMTCADCRAPLEIGDGHDMCPPCLGVEHLRQGLTELACMNCACMSMTVRSARLARLESVFASQPPAVQRGDARATCPPKRKRTHEAPTSSKQGRDDPLSHKVDTLASEFAEIKALLLNLQPGTQAAGAPAAVLSSSSPKVSPLQLSPAYRALDEDVLSIRASESLDFGQLLDEGVEGGSRSSHANTQGTGRSTPGGSEASPMSVRPTMKMALARLGLDPALSTVAPQSAFFRRTSQTEAFSVPPSTPYIEELQRCWADPRCLSHLPSNCRALANMRDASSYGLECMPNIEPSVAALVLSPGEALRPDARCPRPQCRLTDDLIVKSYDTAARIGRIGNSMSHLLLAMSQTLQGAEVDPSVQDLSDTSLQAFAFMTRELGRLMSSLTLARRQIWLAQSPLLEPYRRALRSLPVIPGELFGPAAQQALERSLQVTQARQQFSSLRRGQPYRLRPSTVAAVAPAVPRPLPQPRRAERFRRSNPTQTHPAAQRDQAARRRPHRHPRGRGGRQ